jgi:hypothetical protein
MRSNAYLFLMKKTKLGNKKTLAGQNGIISFFLSAQGPGPLPYSVIINVAVFPFICQTPIDCRYYANIPWVKIQQLDGCKRCQFNTFLQEGRLQLSHPDLFHLSLCLSSPPSRCRPSSPLSPVYLYLCSLFVCASLFCFVKSTSIFPCAPGFL